jgi:hypothetical protein
MFYIYYIYCIYYIKYCKILSRVKKAKRQHYFRLIEKLDNQVKDPEVIADAFNTFLLIITENLNVHQEVKGDAISFLKEAFPTKFPDIKTIPTIETEIKKYNTFPQRKKLIRL